MQLTTDTAHKLIVDVAVSKHPSDSLHLLPALERVRERFGTYPQQAVADGDYTTREAIVGAGERSVDYYGSWGNPGGERMGHGIHPDYQPSAFQHDQSCDEMICPEGRRLRHISTQQKTGGLQIKIYAADREACGCCPQRARCSPQNAMPKHGRAVSLRVEPEALIRYHAKMETPGAKAIYKQRAPVAEFPNAWLKDKLKWVRLRCRGAAKALAEALWACLTYNLQRYFKLTPLRTT